MKDEIKPGDMVKLCKVGAVDWEGTDWAKQQGLMLGSVYKVYCINYMDNRIQVEGRDGANLCHPISKFTKYFKAKRSHYPVWF